ncbi:hypothetical protein RRSWK_04088 [Rhodopirellula sp. SWK7]|nr:hypothetical protein RRSWK_04088 [Rhodopirellula sp. SWK7]
MKTTPDAASASRCGVWMSVAPVNPVSAYPMSSAMMTTILGRSSAEPTHAIETERTIDATRIFMANIRGDGGNLHGDSKSSYLSNSDARAVFRVM